MCVCVYVCVNVYVCVCVCVRIRSVYVLRCSRVYMCIDGTA